MRLVIKQTLLLPSHTDFEAAPRLGLLIMYHIVHVHLLQLQPPPALLCNIHCTSERPQHNLCVCVCVCVCPVHTCKKCGREGDACQSRGSNVLWCAHSVLDACKGAFNTQPPCYCCDSQPKVETCMYACVHIPYIQAGKYMRAHTTDSECQQS